MLFLPSPGMVKGQGIKKSKALIIMVTVVMMRTIVMMIMILIIIIIIIIIIFIISGIRITKVRIGRDLTHFSTNFIQKVSQVRKGVHFQE